jgi:hypothetical protein
VILHYGFMEEVDIPRDLAGIESIGGPFNMMTTSFFLGRQKLIASKDQPGMALWRERLFAWMMQSSESAMEFFKLPTNRVVELGSQLQNLSVAGDPPWPRRRVSKPAGLVATFAPQTSLAAKAPPPWSRRDLVPGVRSRKTIRPWRGRKESSRRAPGRPRPNGCGIAAFSPAV